jgi:hypothetical protein
MIKHELVKQVSVQDWNDLVEKTYGRPYNFQQQDGCKSRGIEIVETNPDWECDYKNDSVPEILNGEEMGVSFKAWLERDPNQEFSDPNHIKTSWYLKLWWDRNFYPHVNMIAEDLCKKGLLEPGEYTIVINW